MPASGTEEVFAAAKINLTLHVTGRRADGYHLLDSLVAFADVGDRLVLAPGDHLRVTGPFAKGVPTDDRNLIRRALTLVGQPRAVTLDKQLPHPAGIGGGSADAAAALRGVGADPGVAQLLTLGADLPVCTLGRAAHMRGIGDRVAAVSMPKVHAVLVNPGLAVPTGAVFAGLASPDNMGHGDLPRWHDAEALIHWLRRQRNDLENPAMAVAPGIDEVRTALHQTDAGVVRMSGSGATCFGLYPTQAAAARAARHLARPGWWVRATRLS
ncbi:4-(cytidine 5'-diphospho)-2-C-methyl-D-erythritol kinase [Jannaschia sp. M317]|uniref:4-(cytidine 5'-diphospho)-2-C-methyl-D-erythritol kinase n=1 Tax=Jannaschia sp. M317 TaxID=2867011 RepID=UPI0021A2C43E|nr:4-(cytidine 5'-diphospho)-2-C-methyl-D-erythritol kinase [Jannaschia sp. M317]UWQ17877.1 4-(cytidine 5'-diphospho)-2-C-methyl-D-erythritol kinase [Jannaschia sp. M317]